MLNAETIIFPRCGLTYGDIVMVTGKYRQKQTVAAKLGVSDSQLDRAVQKYDLNHLFAKQPGEIFTGVTAAEIFKAANRCANMSEAALSLGLVPGTFCRKMKQIGGTQYFKRQKPRKRKVSKRQIVRLAREGYTRPDTAYLLGISSAYLKDLIAMWDLSGEFSVKGGRAAAVTRFGYAWSAGRNMA